MATWFRRGAYEPRHLAAQLRRHGTVAAVLVLMLALTGFAIASVPRGYADTSGPSESQSTPSESGSNAAKPDTDHAASSDQSSVVEEGSEDGGPSGEDAASGTATDDDPTDGSRSANRENGITSIDGERWTSNRKHPSFTVDLSIAKGSTGASVDDIMRLPKNDWHGSGEVSDSYSFFKLSLKGSDGSVTYGPRQQVGGGNETNTGADISRIRVDQRDGHIEFMIKGEWKKAQTSGGGLQFAFYYLQDMLVDLTNRFVKFHVSDWFEHKFVPSGGFSSTPRAAIIEVVNKDTGERLAQSDTMYYYGTTSGISNMTADVIDLKQYQILEIDKFKASYQGADREWTETGKADGNTPLDIYDYAQMRDGTSMNVDWKSGRDPDHVIFTVYVNRTAQVSLIKQVSGDGSDQYRESTFTFSARLSVPEGNTVRGSYTASGLADGKTKVDVTPDAADPLSGTITGIAARPGAAVTIGGLPVGTKIRFSETGVPGDDPSRFITTYKNDRTADTDGSAIAYEPGQDDRDRPQTVTANNEVSSGQGKLTVTKTFSGATPLTDQERIDLFNSFLIESSSKDFPALTLQNPTKVSTPTGILDRTADKVVYTWELSRLTQGTVTLREENYGVSSVNVSTETRVAEDGGSFSPSASVDITERTSTVQFINEFGVRTTDVSISKVWRDTDPAEQLPVSVELDWTGTVIDETSGQPVAGKAGTHEIDSASGWKTTVADLPLHTAAAGDITYTVRETKVGDRTPEKAGFDWTVEPERGTAFTITNTRIPDATLKVHKVDDETKKLSLAGAKFTIRTGTEDGAVFGRETETGADGTATFERLAPGTYFIIESCAPAGYGLAAHGYKIVLGREGMELFAPDDEGTYPATGTEVPLGDDGAYRVTVSDQRLSALPLSGSLGAIAISAAGVAMVAITAYALIRNRHRRG